MDNIKIYYRKNKSIIWIVSCFMLVQLLYRINSTANVPMMDYWQYFYHMKENLFNGGVVILDFFDVNSVHIAILNQLLMYTNIIIFGWNTRVEIIMAIMVTGVTSIYVSNRIILSINEIRGKKYLNHFIVVVVSIVLFSLNQWEIFTLEFALAFSIRIYVYFYLLENIEGIICEKNNKVMGTILLAGIVVCIASGIYFVALFGSITMFMFIKKFVVEKRLKFNMSKNEFKVISMMIISTIIYIMLVFIIKEDGESLNLVLDSKFLENFIKGSLVMIGGSIFYSGDMAISINLYLLGGITVLFTSLFLIYIYIYKGLYRVTYTPVLFILYTIICSFMVSYGRGGANIEYLSSSRYTCEVVFILVGDFWILLLLFINDYEKIYKVSVLAFSLIICISNIYISVNEFMMSKYRREYFIGVINIMKNIDEYGDDELSAFQANKANYVRDSIETMRKYNLGIFKG